jgi:hypothetical protein
MGLFSYLKGYVSEGIPITKDNMELLAAEMQLLQRQISRVDPFLGGSGYDVERAVVEKLSRGDLEDRVRGHLEWRTELARSIRS